jgi:hypothetical protein
LSTICDAEGNVLAQTEGRDGERILIAEVTLDPSRKNQTVSVHGPFRQIPFPLSVFFGMSMTQLVGKFFYQLSWKRERMALLKSGAPQKKKNKWMVPLIVGALCIGSAAYYFSKDPHLLVSLRSSLFNFNGK